MNNNSRNLIPRYLITMTAHGESADGTWMYAQEVQGALLQIRDELLGFRAYNDAHIHSIGANARIQEILDLVESFHKDLDNGYAIKPNSVDEVSHE